MLEKTIRKKLKAKIGKWANSVTDEPVKEAILQDVIITGGAIVSLVNNEEPNDYDVYFRTFESLKLVTEYYIKEFNTMKPHVKAHLKLVPEYAPCEGYIPLDDIREGEVSHTNYCNTCSSGNSCSLQKRITAFVQSTGKGTAVKRDKKKKYVPVYITSNAITLSEDVQFILRFWGEAAEIHKNYDFKHCTGYYDMGEDNISIPAEVYECIINKTLKYQGSLYPLCSIIRLRKFIKRGYTINGGEVLKMCYQVSKLDLDNLAVLEDQLTGVDTAYFGQLIEALKDKKVEDPSWGISDLYLCQLIDDIFDA